LTGKKERLKTGAEGDKEDFGKKTGRSIIKREKYFAIAIQRKGKFEKKLEAKRTLSSSL